MKWSKMEAPQMKLVKHEGEDDNEVERVNLGGAE